MKKVRTNNILSFILIMMISFVLMSIYMGFDINALIVDDNYHQWLPVMEESYGVFLRTGKMPLYDFYQAGGMDIAEGGYYGQQNPTMFVSYLIGRGIFGHVSTISVFIFIMFSLGNLCMFRLLRRIGCSAFSASLCTAMYAASGAYITFSFWHYIWGNYLILPLLLLAVLYSVQNENIMANLIVGLVLAYSLTLGNVQYTFYHYIVFSIVYLVLLVADFHKSSLFKLLSNFSVAVMLSAPMMMLQLDAAGRRAGLIEEKELLAFGIPRTAFDLFSFIPINVFYLFTGGNVQSTSLARDGSFCEVPYSYVYSGFLLFGVIAYFCLVLYNIIKKDHSFFSKDKVSVLILGVFISALFFIFFSLGPEGGVARILSRLPVISQFRFAFKAVFLYVPLCVVPAGHMLDKLYHVKTPLSYAAVTALVIFVVMGVVQNCWIVNSGEHTFFRDERIDQTDVANDLSWHLTEAGVDFKNYRVLSVLNTTTDNDFEKDLVAIGRQNHLITYNMPTRAHVFTLGAYEATAPMICYELCDHILVTPVYCYSRANAASAHQILDGFEKDDEFYKEFVRQIKANSVKYLLFKKDGDQCDKFIEYIKKNGQLGMENVQDLYDDVYIVTLADIPSLCYDATIMENISLDSRIDQLSFGYKALGEDDLVRLSFGYDDSIIAYYFGTDNRRVFLNVTESDDRYILIRGFPAGQEVTVVVHKDYPLAVISFVFGYVSCVMLIMAGVGVTLEGRRKSKAEMKTA